MTLSEMSIKLLLGLMIVSLILWLIGKIISGIILEMLNPNPADKLTDLEIAKGIAIMLLGQILIAIYKAYTST